MPENIKKDLEPEHRLKSTDITLREMLKISLDYYKKYDNKIWRAKVDIKSARLVWRKNFKYNPSTFSWEQTGRDARFDFIVKSDPVSYENKTPLKFHFYPVTFLIHDIELGLDSPFKWRTGSIRKPKFPKKGDSFQKRKQIELYNLRNGIQLNFFFYLEWILYKYGLLFGKNYAAWPPHKTNPHLLPFFDKHAFFITNKIMTRLLTGEGKKLLQGKLHKNDGK